MRISDWSSDVCSSDLCWKATPPARRPRRSASTSARSPASTASDMESGDRGTLAQRSRAALAEGGVLATQIPGFAPRPSQQDFAVAVADALDRQGMRSEEHTSELQSLMRISYAVFCLKKKKQHKT